MVASIKQKSLLENKIDLPNEIHTINILRKGLSTNFYNDPFKIGDDYGFVMVLPSKKVWTKCLFKKDLNKVKKLFLDSP